MSRSTEIILSTSASNINLADSISPVLKMTGADEVFIASRTINESREFERYTAFLRGETDDQLEDYNLLGRELKLESIPSLYRNGSCLMLDMSNCPLAELLDSAIRQKIPQDDLGEFG